MTLLEKTKLELSGLAYVPLVLLVLCCGFLSLFVAAVLAADPVSDSLDLGFEAARRGIEFGDAAWIFLACFLFTLTAYALTVIYLTRVLLRLSTRPCIAAYLQRQEDDRLAKEHHR